MTDRRQVVLIILDGWGYREELDHNAIAVARTPVFDRIWRQYPHALLEASGEAVGLPAGQMGNSEIGHTTIGAGRALDTDLVRIEKAIRSGEFATNPAFVRLFDHVKQYDSTLHVQGLVSDGGVHSHSDHLKAFLRSAQQAGITKIAIHVFTDGRDTAPQSAAGYLREIESLIDDIGIGHIATATGRFYAMDRNNNWDRLARAEAAVFECTGTIVHNQKPSAVIENLYREGVIDELMEPVVFLGEQGRDYRIQPNDGVFYFNFRADRARMLSQKILDRVTDYNLCFVTMTEYDKGFNSLVAFPSLAIETTLAQEVAGAGLRQAHIAETEKFPHATYFLNGGREEPHEGERHIMLESRRDVPTHDLAPKMRAEGIADAAIDQLTAGTEFIFINFANPDMVGHTANVPAIIEAVEEVDAQLGRVLDALHARGGVAFVTADHGNAEVNVDLTTGDKHTAHTTNLVPAIITNTEGTMTGGSLADIAPTVLALLSLPVPGSMSGRNLFEQK